VCRARSKIAVVDMTLSPDSLNLFADKYANPYFTLQHSSQKSVATPNKFFLTPNIAAVLAELLDSYKINTNIYYIFNEENGKNNLDKLLDYEIQLVPIKVFNVKNCRNILK
jgi:hypothetical protein